MYNTLGFTTKVERDAEYDKMKATGARGIVRYTTHDQNHPQIVYVLAHPVVSVVTHSEVPLEIGTEVPLSDALASDMISEGGNSNETAEPVATIETPSEAPSA